MADVALREYVNEIDGMIENSAFDIAIQHCRHILSQYPKYLEVYRVLGKALLEKDDYAAAGDVFQRVISVDPEDFVARVGLSIVHDRQGDLDKAIWHMERAYDLMPSNEIIQSELRRLCGRRDGRELERISLTRSALARMYANGDLTDEAVANLRQLLHDQPDRVDLQILLAEVLWRGNQRIEASNLAQTITAKLPYCLKANLILGEILQASDSSDSETPFRRAQAADPDNLQAAQLFGSESPLPVRHTMVTRLEQMSYGQMLETDGSEIGREEVPDWLRGLADLNAPLSQLESPESATNPPLPTGLHMPGTEPAHGEIPEWLQGLTAPQPEPAEPSQEVPDWLTALGTASLTDKATPPASPEPSEDWLAQLRSTNKPEPAMAMRDEDVPDWILQLGTGALDPQKLPQTEQAADETPDWMKQLGVTGTLAAEPAEAPAASVGDETPDWLQQLGSTGPLGQAATPESAAQSSAPAESADIPDWLQQLGSTGPLNQEIAPAEALAEPTVNAETPDWLQQLGGTGALDQTVVSAGPADEAPDWLAQLQSTLPPIDQSQAEETPDWLAQLGSTGPLSDVQALSEVPTPPAIPAPPPARKISVDADRATIERLVEAFGPSTETPETSAEPEVEEPSFLLGDAASEVGKAGAGLVLGGAALAGAAASGLAGLVKSHDELSVEEPSATELTSLEADAILEGDISPDDALAFFARLTAGKEDQLRAEAEAEGESRMAAIMGRKAEPVVEAKPVEPEPVIEPVAEVVMPQIEVPVESEPVAAEAAAIMEGDISPDDALAFFARLTAGKEDQLRAEAEAEGESRMAAIMGRKAEPVVEAKPVEPEPVIEPVAEVVTPQVEVPVESEPIAAEAAAILEGDISPDDALAFFARLTAGKEDQLRAEAEAEGESRMAAIMGRKAEPEKPVEVAQPSAAEPVDLASTEDTTDWLAQLSAAAALAAAVPATELPEEEPQDWLKGLGEPAAVVAPAEELPDWLRAMRPPEETVSAESSLASAAEEIEVTPAEALPDWLRAMQPAAEVSTPIEAVPTDEVMAMVEAANEAPTADLTPESELPNWLQDLQPAPDAVTELTPAESLPDWLRNLQPAPGEAMADQIEVSEPVMDLPKAEESPVAAQSGVPQPSALQIEASAPVTEGLPEPMLTPVSTLVQSITAPATPTWWTQSAEDEGEAPIAELPEPVRMVSATARMTPAASSATPAGAPRTPITRAMRDRLPERSTRESRRRESRPAESSRAETLAPVVGSVNVDPLVEQLEADKFNHTVRLELARAWWSMGNRDSALAEYGKLINPAQVENLSDEELAEIEERDFADAGPVADAVIVDLERIIEMDEHPVWPRLLGDLYMKTGDLARALEMYRRALSQL